MARDEAWLANDHKSLRPSHKDYKIDGLLTLWVIVIVIKT